MHKKPVFLIAATIILSIVFYALWATMMRSQQNQSMDLERSEEELEGLKALPYTDWTENSINESLRGVTKHDPTKSFDGYNFYTNDVNQVYLMDMSGARVHTWYTPAGYICNHAELLDNGGIVSLCEFEALLGLDWNSRLLWNHQASVHHDFTVLPDKSLLALVREDLKRYNTLSVYFDSILHLSESGQILDRWSTFENLDFLKKLHAPLALDRQEVVEAQRERPYKISYDYYHLNRIAVLPDTPVGRKDSRFQAGNLLVCFRNANLLAVLKKDTKRILWHWGTNVLDFPHTPTMLDNGNILIFDNGTHRKYSRVLEINPLTSQIVWEYKANPPQSFFSAWRGSAQRLPNGNTLICDSQSGRAFEVDSNKQVVWEFWNPEIRDGKRKRIYRFMRVSKEKIGFS